MGDNRVGGIASFGVSFGDTPGAPDDEKAVFRIVVIGEFVARDEWSTGRRPSPNTVAIDAESFDRVFGELAPSLAIDVEDPFSQGDKPLRVDLVWNSRKAMRPSAIAAQVPSLHALVEAWPVVRDMVSQKRSVEDARAHLERILPRASWTEALTRVARRSGEARSAGQTVAARQSSLDALFDLVDMPGCAPAAAPPVRVADETAPQLLARAFQRLLGSVLRHPEVRRLESAWLGLRLLVDHCDKRAGVKLDVVCASRDDVTDALAHLATADALRAPVDLIVIDQTLEPTAIDLGRLQSWAEGAEALLAPIVLGGSPSMLGAPSLESIANSTRSLTTSADPRAVATRAAASRDAMRWVAVVLNEPLVRTAYTSATARQAEPPYEEDAADESAHVFANGSFVVAALCARSFARMGWPTPITGARDGALGGLPVRTVREKGAEAAIPVRIASPDGALREVARAGFVMLACAPNTDAAVVISAPTFHRPLVGGSEPAATLADQLFVSRFARAVHGVAGSIPAGTAPRAAEEAACIALMDTFVHAPPSGPDVSARVDSASGSIHVTVRPRRFAGVSLEELTIAAPLG